MGFRAFSSAGPPRQQDAAADVSRRRPRTGGRNQRRLTPLATKRRERMTYAELDSRLFDHRAAGGPARLRLHRRDRRLDRKSAFRALPGAVRVVAGFGSQASLKEATFDRKRPNRGTRDQGIRDTSQGGKGDKEPGERATAGLRGVGMQGRATRSCQGRTTKNRRKNI